MPPVERLRPHQRVDRARGRPPAQDGQVVARHLLPEDRAQPLGGGRPDPPRQPGEPRFVPEDQHPALTPRRRWPRRPGRLAASEDLLVPRDGPPDRHLGRPTPFAEPPPDVAVVVADAALVREDSGAAAAGPDLAAEAEASGPCPRNSGINRFCASTAWADGPGWDAGPPDRRDGRVRAHG